MFYVHHFYMTTNRIETECVCVCVLSVAIITSQNEFNSEYIFFLFCGAPQSVNNEFSIYTFTKSLACSKMKKKINKLVHATVSGHCVCINYLHDNELVSLLIVFACSHRWDILKAFGTTLYVIWRMITLLFSIYTANMRCSNRSDFMMMMTLYSFSCHFIRHILGSCVPWNVYNTISERI